MEVEITKDTMVDIKDFTKKTDSHTINVGHKILQPNCA